LQEIPREVAWKKGGDNAFSPLAFMVASGGGMGKVRIFRKESRFKELNQA
jgi:hypothetical protein